MNCKNCTHPQGTHHEGGCSGRIKTGATSFLVCTCKNFELSDDAKLLDMMDALNAARLKVP